MTQAQKKSALGATRNAPNGMDNTVYHRKRSLSTPVRERRTTPLMVFIFGIVVGIIIGIMVTTALNDQIHKFESNPHGAVMEYRMEGRK